MAGPAAEGANGDRDSVDDVIERLLSVRGERGEGGCRGCLCVRGWLERDAALRLRPGVFFFFRSTFSAACVNAVQWFERLVAPFFLGGGKSCVWVGVYLRFSLETSMLSGSDYPVLRGGFGHSKHRY